MAFNEAVEFDCGHKTVYGQIGAKGKLRAKKGTVLHCRDCAAFRTVKSCYRQPS